MVKKDLKGISPVIATILMVMITVGLVAFSYSWFIGMGERAQQQARSQLSGMEKSQQNIDIPTAYECEDDTICFELRASSMNTIEIPMNDTYISAYVDGAPKELYAWNGGLSDGKNCTSYSGNLKPGESCYGNVTVDTCDAGDIYTLKITHTWGASKMESVRCD